jgi:hypothetical protein
MGKYALNDKVNIIYEEIKKIAPEKISGIITLETSITNEIALDSIEIMDLLISIQEEVKKRSMDDSDVNIDRLLSYLLSENDDLTVKSLCDFMEEL